MKWAVYQTYLAASSYYVWAILVLLIVIQQLRGVGEKVWIKVWTSAYPTPLNVSSEYMFRHLGTGTNDALLANDIPFRTHLHSGGWQMNRLPSAAENPWFYLGVYTAIGMFGILVQLLAVVVQYTGALRASRVLFK